MNKIPKLQRADLKGKVVLIRVDHNVVKKEMIKDPYRIDASLPTIEYIIANGGKPIVMTHVGRPRDKKTKQITISEETAVEPIISYLNEKLDKKFVGSNDFSNTECDIENLAFLAPLLQDLKNDRIDGIYLPNTRWFAGEEAGGEITEYFGRKLAGLADIFINDAFGSWQPHASTVEPAKHIPSYAGLLMQKEVENLQNVLEPERPLLAVVAGSKFDTKIGPLTALMEKADYLVLGGVIYNAYLSAKYGLKIKGISPEDVKAAAKFLQAVEKFPRKIVELLYIVESDDLESKNRGKFRNHNIFTSDKLSNLNYILDASPRSFAVNAVRDVFRNAGTIFVNAVMGYTPNFYEGSQALYNLIAENEEAMKFLGGGDTLQEFKTLLPDVYEKALADDKYYFFTGGGTILKAIDENSPFGLEPIQELLRNQSRFYYPDRRAGKDRRDGDERRHEKNPVQKNHRFKERRAKDRRISY